MILSREESWVANAMDFRRDYAVLVPARSYHLFFVGEIFERILKASTSWEGCGPLACEVGPPEPQHHIIKVRDIEH